MNAAFVKTALTGASKIFYKTCGKVKKASPEILLGLGIATVIGGTVMACVAAKNSDDIAEEATAELKKVEAEAAENPSINVGKEKFRVYAKTTGKYVKLFAPAALMTASGIGFILTSHGIMKARNSNLIAAYSALDTSYKDLCKRLEEKLGKEEADNMRLGLEDTDIPFEVEDDKGKKKTEIVTAKTTWGETPSIYSKMFDRSSGEWEDDPSLNRLKLTARQNFWTQVLQSKGHVFLNEIYRDLDLKETPEGQVVGWVLGPNNANYIDFGMFNVYNVATDDHGNSIVIDNRRFVNGKLQDVLLDFNVDGVIIDKI